jgi:hypothetical protein
LAGSFFLVGLVVVAVALEIIRRLTNGLCLKFAPGSVMGKQNPTRLLN